MLVIKISGFLAFVTSFIGLLPQLVKSIKTRSTADLSMLMLINYLICSGAWIIYGISTSANFVVWSNVIGAIICFILIFFKVHYDSQFNRP